MVSRRDFVGNLGATLGAMCLCSTDLWGQQNLTSLPAGIGVEPDFTGALPKLKSGGSLGDRPPLDSEEKVAKAIIVKSPVGPTPFDVAKFFLAVGKGEYGKLWQPYAQGWPLRWNPVIVNFFQATRSEPRGDLTPWCAAFLNWCFVHAGKGFATRDASSGSFRTFGVETSSPSPGDIVVFRHTTPVAANDMQGHVGFFVKMIGTEVVVLGGNQIEGHEKCHMVSVKALEKNGSKLTLHSFRTDTRLHM
jgi:uncharacterized protein (TIGR02594 family)